MPSTTSSSSFQGLVETAAVDSPRLAFILGSGMGPLAGRCRAVCRLPFGEVPGLAVPTVVGHGGCLTLADWAGRRVLVFEGRLHYYEGHPWERVVRPVEIARELGARVLLLTNAAGGIHDDLGPGSLMVLRDQLEWARPGGWRQPLGSRPSPYSERLRRVLQGAAAGVGLRLHEGVYGAVTGPCYETPAEIRALRACGADAVGMSTAREARRAHELGLECAAVSLVTNRAAGLSCGTINHEEVLATAEAQAERLADLLEAFLKGVDEVCE